MNQKQISLIAGTAVCMLIVLFTVVYALPSYLSVQADDITPCDLENLPADAVSAVTKAGLMQTTVENGQVYFHPEDLVTRAELAKTLTCLLKLPARTYREKTLGFADEETVKAEMLPYVRVSLAYGYMKLYPDLRFRPDESVTREETADIIGSLLVGEISSGKSEALSDFEEVSAHFSHNAEKAVDHGIMEGFSDGTFQPKKTLTRGELALILHKLLQNEHLLQRK